MRFKDSPVVELPVGGAVLSFEQDNSSFHVGTSVWPCSLVLVKFVERWLPPQNPQNPNPNPNPNPSNPYADLLRLAGKRGIELGSGCGPAGLGFDFVVAADVVYLADSAPHLVAAIDALLAPRGLLLLAYQLRSPDAHRAFWDLCARAFPVVVKVPRDHLHPDYAFDEADVYLMQRQQT
ncbi:uncharacterized protein LOC109722048 [Ananas comosus]|uniref:Uncharacterized protein LOC109722048 n=1 Tax=Ananas comosus TaxID=4615 RepID=A0A6P5GHK7_ANACO|nr:uncharacterized protein LOC109722048 [Ananas comosus]XP_020105503.1 uncharacterized protein LOC109722048 [Ananas comosus]